MARREDRPVTVVVAAAGYGKTTAVRRWLAGRDAAWYTGSDLPEQFGAGTIVVDGTDQVDWLDRLPAGARVLITSRTPLAGPLTRLRAQGRVSDISAADLAMSPAAVGEVLRGYDAERPETVTALHRATGGWPALVHRAAPTVPAATGPDLLDAVAGRRSDVYAYVADEVLPALPAAARRLIADLAELRLATGDLVEALGHRDGPAALRLLQQLGLVRPVGGGYRLVPAVAPAARQALRPARRDRVLATATRWYAANGEPAEAVATALAAGDEAGCAALLARHGAHLLSSGGALRLVSTVRALAPAHRDQQVTLLFAEALQATGDVDEALAVYADLAGPAGPLPPAVAWRYGMARYLRGKPDGGLSVLSRSAEPDHPDPDGALLLAWTAAAHWRQGNAAACGEAAERAHRAALAVGDGKALAAAHVALALHAQLCGDRPAVQTHYEQALAAAEAGGDWFAAVRIRTNRSSSLVHEARYREALAMVQPAVALAEAGGFRWALGAALVNEGDALSWLGRFDEAVQRQERAVKLWQHLRSDKVAYSLASLGDLHRRRHRFSQARAAYEEAVRRSEQSQDRQPMVPALAGLARVVAETDPAEAVRIADRALAVARGPALATALLARGWAAEAAGLDDARRYADESAATARGHRDPRGLAEALELTAHLTADRTVAARLLGEALAIWRDAGADIETDRVQIALARRTGRPDDQVRARLAAGRLAAAGVVPRPETLPPAPAAGPEPVEVHTLGRFTVLVGGTAVAVGAWQSRKARDLLRVLVARRGRQISRDELANLLWPGEAGDKVAHRLSVALSTARAVLDPGRGAPADHFIRADAGGLALDVTHVVVDAEDFARYAQHGLRMLRGGQVREARDSLEAAERLYVGDFGEDEPYDEHSRTVREELRAVFLQVARALAQVCRDAGQPDDAGRHLLRLLSFDPYDEPAHRELVELLTANGRHGEAQRARARYVAAMREIGVAVGE